MIMQPLSGPILYLLLTVGLIFALAGLRLVFTKSSEENAARIELFGLKFQSSSAGLLVLLIGAAFLAVPIFNPPPPAQSENVLEPSKKQLDQGPAALNPPSAKPPKEAILLPQEADTPEAEPNNKITDANQFALGFGAVGSIDKKRNDFEDWYVIDISGSEAVDFSTQIRSPGGCLLTVYDAQEEQIGYTYCNNGGGSQAVDVFAPNNDRLYLRVSFNGGSGRSKADYEVFMREK